MSIVWSIIGLVITGFFAFVFLGSLADKKSIFNLVMGIIFLVAFIFSLIDLLTGI